MSSPRLDLCVVALTRTAANPPASASVYGVSHSRKARVRFALRPIPGLLLTAYPSEGRRLAPTAREPPLSLRLLGGPTAFRTEGAILDYFGTSLASSCPTAGEAWMCDY